MAPAQTPDGNPHGGMQTSVPYAAIPFLAILGAVALLMICWAFARLLADPEDGLNNFSESQMQYMREVRQRNRQDIEDLFGARRYRNYPPPQFSTQPSSQRQSTHYFD